MFTVTDAFLVKRGSEEEGRVWKKWGRGVEVCGTKGRGARVGGGKWNESRWRGVEQEWVEGRGTRVGGGKWNESWWRGVERREME